MTAVASVPARPVHRASRSGPRVLCVQFSDPGLYPPVMNAAALLAEAGCELEFISARPSGGATLPFAAPEGSVVRTLVAPPGGIALKRFYGRFALEAARAARRHSADWLYVSDPMAAPAGLLAARASGARVVYHEHDSPSGGSGLAERLVLRARNALARRADVVVLPSRERGERLRVESGRSRPVSIVWNCPRLAELPAARHRATDGPIRFLYSGSLSPERLPLAVVDAIAALDVEATLVVVGYETPGAPGYLAALRDRARVLGAGHRLELRGALPRASLLDAVATCDVGLCILPLVSDDSNMTTMVGASNKAFDYLAGGLALLVPRDARWHEEFVRPGYAREMDAASSGSIGEMLAWCASHRGDVAAMGAAGRARVEREWNYDAAFAPVRDALLAPAR